MRAYLRLFASSVQLIQSLSDYPMRAYLLLFASTTVLIQSLTLSPTAPFAPPCPTALGLIGPRKKERKKTGFDDVS
jgi:hypothetical protein